MGGLSGNRLVINFMLKVVKPIPRLMAEVEFESSDQVLHMQHFTTLCRVMFYGAINVDIRAYFNADGQERNANMQENRMLPISM